MKNIHQMLRNCWRRIFLLLVWFLFSWSGWGQGAAVPIRYVNAVIGKFEYDGKSWQKPKRDLQDAIDDLRLELEKNTGAKKGYVFMAGGDGQVYTPTVSTGEEHAGALYTSFKMYAGIEVYGGFHPNPSEAEKETIATRQMKNGADSQHWEFTYPTVLSGNHSEIPTQFEWNENTHRYRMGFPGNSYHVVWFATNGFEDEQAKALKGTAVIDGVIIEDGNAGSLEVNKRDHRSYGGGAYMVDGAVLRNCEIRQCHAIRSGGGVFLDGGGRVENCYLHRNQSEGNGLLDGYGGAACIRNKGLITRCIIADNMARIGGGLSLWRESTIVNLGDRFLPAASACVVTNNTASVEAGGIFLDNGGNINQMTVVRNQCTGSEIIVNGHRYGLSGGIYAVGSGLTFNTVLWGNEVGTSNAQFASYVPDANEKTIPKLEYAAVSNYEKSDWSGMVLHKVIALTSKMGSVKSKGVLDPDFQRVTKRAGVQKEGTYSDAFMAECKASALTDEDRKKRFEFFWRPMGFSPLRNAGVLLSSFIDYDFLLRSNTSHDVFGKEFNVSSTVGAIVAVDAPYCCAKMPDMEMASNANPVLTIFVDPAPIARKYQDGYRGDGWERPVRAISDALNYIRMARFYGKIAYSSYDKTTGKWNYQLEKVTPETPFQVLLKEGVSTTVGDYSFGHLRTTHLHLEDRVRLYGGYPKELRFQVIDSIGLHRNPKKYPSIISADILESDKDKNAVHVLALDGSSHTILDGVRLEQGYSLESQSVNYDPQLKVGAGLLIQDCLVDEANTKPMLNNKVRNCVISNCTANQGSAVWARACKNNIEISFENCVFHNNTALDAHMPSTIYASAENGKKVTMKFNHCDFLKNVGYAAATGEGDVTVDMKNSVVWANAAKAYEHSAELSKNSNEVRTLKFASGTKISLTNCMLDKGLIFPVTWKLSDCHSVLTYGLDDKDEQGNSTYPIFINPTKNIGAVYERNQTRFGGEVDFTPRNLNPMVNKAKDTEVGNDMNMAARSYGGLPDIGALENQELPEKGKVYYVKATGGNDANNGLSWGTAFQTLSHACDVAYNLSQATIDAGVEIWVAEGTYQHLSAEGDTIENERYAYRMQEGVNIIGGFPTLGNPGLLERNPKLYPSILQPSDKDPSDRPIDQRSREKLVGRVLVQEKNFVKETVWDGFTLRNGYLFTWFRQNLEDKIYSLRVDYVSKAGGAGALLKNNGVLKNCIIENNMTFADPQCGWLEVPGYMNRKYNLMIDSNQEGGYHQVGAGIYNMGGTLENCNIRNNKLIHWCSRHPKIKNECHPYWLYGAGLYQENGFVYNTIISGNICEGDVSRIGETLGRNNVVAGAGVVLVEGAFFNNTVVENSAKTHGCNRAHISVPAAFVFQNATMYNCIITNNKSKFLLEGKRPDEINNTGKNKFTYYDYPIIAFVNKGYDLDSSKVSAHFCCVDISNLNEKDQIKKNLLNKKGSPSKDSTNIFLDPLLAANYSLKDNSPCFNKGTTDIYYKKNGQKDSIPIALPNFDAAYTDRIKDCAVDIGAYELNKAYNINPTVIEGKKGQLIYYVSQNGKGVNSGANPDNAACAMKLQKILDAAGKKRYDIENEESLKAYKDYEIVVRLASEVDFAYTPLRTSVTDPLDLDRQNPRTYSLMMPRGVTLEGGWTTDFEGENKNLKQDIVNNKTKISGRYNVGDQNVNGYHIFTFTQDVYDKDGNVLQKDGLADVQREAILDGLFLEEGKANGEKDIYQEGAVARVPAYGHVRNCILQNNQSLRGGALFLEPGALVSGCLFQKNEADDGGAIYVQKNAEVTDEPDENAVKGMAQVFTSTMIDNEAVNEGGALWFDNNVRMNSCVLWKNKGSVGANIFGKTNPKATQVVMETAYLYPLAYCAVENVRAPGLDNIQVSSEENLGVRFNSSDVYYLPTSYSVLARAGMPVVDYHQLMEKTSVKSVDFRNVPRAEKKDKQGKNYSNDFIEIGARAYRGRLSNEPLEGLPLLKRIYVAPPATVDPVVVDRLQKSDDKVYKQMGSSFSYPMIHLEDAFEYIRKARSKEKLSDPDNPNIEVCDVRFEVFVAAGTYYPFRNIKGEFVNSRSSTYLVPEGVSVMGGFNNKNSRTMKFCQKTTGKSLTVQSAAGSVELLPQTTTEILQSREAYDMNVNGIIEPWEMKHQTILSGHAVNNDWSDDVYHVITCVPNSNYVGKLPTCTSTNNVNPQAVKDGVLPAEKGQYILFDGLEIIESTAMKRLPNAVFSNKYFSRGGGILVTGNWMKDNKGKDVWLNQNIPGNPDAVGYRDIPLVVRNCRFNNNEAGEGAAIFSDGTLEIYSCSFEQNKVMSGKEIVAPSGSGNGAKEESFYYYGHGGAVSVNYILLMANSMFENNEAIEGETLTDGSYPRGIGGAVNVGLQGYTHAVNCDFVRNLSKEYPAIYYCRPNKKENGVQKIYNTVTNSVFWGNEAQGKDLVVTYDQENIEEAAEALWFSAYEKGKGRTPFVMTKDDAPDFRKATFGEALRDLPTYLFEYAQRHYDDLYSGTSGNEEHIQEQKELAKKVNNNILISSDNYAMDGPNFGNPSRKAGVEGYLPNADWMPFRENLLTDNGWTYLEEVPKTDKEGNPTTDFKKDNSGNFIGDGPYHMLYTQNTSKDPDHLNLYMGDEPYMAYALTPDKKMFRISLNPNVATNEAEESRKVFIDLGVYEFHHAPLKPMLEGIDRDVLWVSNSLDRLSGVPDGSSWNQPTTNLQLAIETLLANRNDHNKEVRIIEGNYSPRYTFTTNNVENRGYLINTHHVNGNVTLSKEDPNTPKGVKSLTFTGGWSKDLQNVRDVKAYPSVIENADKENPEEKILKYLFYIEDVTQLQSYRKPVSTAILHNELTSVVPIRFDGVSIMNTYADGDMGAAIYYKRQETKKGDLLKPAKGENDEELPKLVISRSKFFGNGLESVTPKETSAVKIEDGGGHAFIYNSLFHSNAGKALEALNTEVLNCTFALNNQPVDLTGELSKVSNSVFWRNTPLSGGGWGSQILPETWNNGSDNAKFVYNAVQGWKGGDAHHNVNLTADNLDFVGGPNFVNPQENLENNMGNETLLTQRNFELLPSFSLLNAGEIDVYCQSVIDQHIVDNSIVEIKNSWLRRPFLESDKMKMQVFRTDGSNENRWIDKQIDRGAFEYQSSLRRVVYMDPNRNMLGTGEDWSSPYGMEQMQSAIDMVAMYCQGHDDDAYVFMKGNNNGHTGEHLTLRPGVQVFGSIDPNYVKVVPKGSKGEEPSTEMIERYVKQMKEERPALLAQHTVRTAISGVTLDRASFAGKNALFDGFEVSANPKGQDILSPAVNLYMDDGQVDDATAVVMKNCWIHNFYNRKMSGTLRENAIVDINHALLYNTLVSDNMTSMEKAIVTLGEHGYMVNTTVAATGLDVLALSVPKEVTALRVTNSVTYNAVGDDHLARTGNPQIYGKMNQQEHGNPFAPYFNEQTLLKGNRGWDFQLIEHSPMIHGGDEYVNFLPESLWKFISYDEDRDLLGNPRVIGRHVDCGAYETWSTEGKPLTLDTRPNHYGGHFYPHSGSVVYTDAPMEVSASDFDKTRVPAVQPGYFLLQQGGGWYGHGAVELDLSYASVERKLGQYNLLSLPFAYDYRQGAQRASYGADHMETVLPHAVESYDSNQRAASTYRFAASNSSCWLPVTSATAANQGVSYALPWGSQEGVFRFTAAADHPDQWVYSENDQAKTVTLLQYDKKDLQSGGPAGNQIPEFTVYENMGWNLFGMPYMVSAYQTARQEMDTHTGYALDVPHLLYDLSAKGQYATLESWHQDFDGSVVMNAGEAYFSQTAVVDQPQETLTFALPQWEETVAGTATHQRLLFGSRAGTDEVVLLPSVEAADLTYHWGADGVKWMAEDVHLPQVYLASRSGTRFSLASAAPLNQEMKLGIRTTGVGDYTFSVSDKEVATDYDHVWLKDKQTAEVVDLLSGDYAVTLNKNEDTAERFVLKLGGKAPEGDACSPATYRVYLDRGDLHVHGLQGGETLEVYDRAGRLIIKDEAQTSEYTTPLPTGVYVVKINTQVYKVR